MSSIARTDQSVLGRWWWTVDRWTVGALVLLVLFGALMTFAASPPVAERIGLDSYHFVRRQMMILPVAALAIFAISLLEPKDIRRLAVLALLGCFALLVVTPLLGAEIKGARRWLTIGGFTIQPSEFAKPVFAVVCAWMLAEWRKSPRFPGQYIAVGLYLVLAGLLIIQPDLGQTVVVSAVWFCQFFLAGLPMALVTGLVIAGAMGIVGAYFMLPHVTSRIDRFLDPASGDTYQVSRSLEAFANGGAFGTGPGEGDVKSVLPDAHADFVFAVAGEEFGAIVAVGLVLLFAFVVLRGFGRAFQQNDLFILLAVGGLLAQFGLQAVIHMASSLSLMPAKGMTLPFVSYGGSSLLALGLGMGMVLALTRRRPGREGLL